MSHAITATGATGRRGQRQPRCEPSDGEWLYEQWRDQRQATPPYPQVPGWRALTANEQEAWAAIVYRAGED